MNNQKIIDRITELYYDKLEAEAIQYTYWNDIGNNQSEQLVKDEYVESIENMIDYIWGLDTWQGQWALMNAGFDDYIVARKL